MGVNERVGEFEDEEGLVVEAHRAEAVMTGRQAEYLLLLSLAELSK